MQRVVLLICGVAVAYWYFFGANASVAVETNGTYSYPNYSIEPKQAYNMQARVLGKKNYSRGREAELSPVDLALGWGPMKDPDNLREIDISQNGRFYFWRVKEFPIPRREIEHNSANVHIVPANEQIARALSRVETGDEVELSGQLVNISAQDGWRWRSSLSFTDTGGGSCELLWLEEIRII